MYGCESWTIKKVERLRIDVFELWGWRRLLRVPWTARRSNQSIQRKSVLNIHWKDWCWSWNSNTLATWCKELIHLKRPWCWERLKAGEEKGVTEDEMVGWHHRLNGHEFGWTLGVGDRQGGLVCCDSWGCKNSDTTEQLNWTELKLHKCIHAWKPTQSCNENLCTSLNANEPSTLKSLKIRYYFWVPNLQSLFLIIFFKADMRALTHLLSRTAGKINSKKVSEDSIIF